jgi:hypothetical protein
MSCFTFDDVPVLADIDNVDDIHCLLFELRDSARPAP